MPGTAINKDFQYIFRPFWVLSPLSITMASASLNHKFLKTLMYRIYIILSLTPPTAFGCYHFLALEHKAFAPFSRAGAVCTQWLLYFITSVYLVVTFGKRRVYKLLLEIQELDVLLHYKSKSLIFKMAAHNIMWIVYLFVFYILVSIVYMLAELYLVEGSRFNITVIYLIIFFNVIDIVMACEVACFSTMSIIFYMRMRHFVTYLKVYLAGRNKDKELNVTSCYRQIHRVLKRLEKAFHVQIMLVIGFCFYSSLRMSLILAAYEPIEWLIYLNVMITVRYLGVYLLLGAVGQGVVVQLRTIKVLALLMTHSQNGKMQSVGARISAEAEMRPRGLRALGAELDARLPLRMLAVLASALTMLLQLGVNLDNE